MSILAKIPPDKFPWALTGSAGLRLQGVDIPVHDLDLQTDARTVHQLEKELTEFMRTPVHDWETEHTFSHHGQADIDGIQVELLGGMRHRAPDGSWEKPAAVKSIRVWVDWRGHGIPVLPLEHEARAYAKMGREQKAELIRSACETRKPYD